jgi:hypothetical protein
VHGLYQCIEDQTRFGVPRGAETSLPSMHQNRLPFTLI